MLLPSAFKRFLDEKAALAVEAGTTVSQQQVQEVLQSEAILTKDDVIRLRVERRLLAPVFLQTREFKGAIAERIEHAKTELTSRADRIQSESETISQEVDQFWPNRSLEIVPGSTLLERVAAKFGLAYIPSKGVPRGLPDSSAADVPYEIRLLLQEISES